MKHDRAHKTSNAFILRHIPTVTMRSGGKFKLVAASDRAPEPKMKRWNAVNVLVDEYEILRCLGYQLTARSGLPWDPPRLILQAYSIA